MLRNNLRITIRNLLRYKVFSALNVAGIAIALTCVMVISVFVRYENNFDTFHRKSHRTYRIVQHTHFPDGDAYWNTTAYPLAEALRKDLTHFESVTQISGPHVHQIAITSNGALVRYEEKNVLFADRFYGDVFDIVWRAGNRNTAFGSAFSVVLTEETAQKYFGDAARDPADIIGRVVFLENAHALSVTGIIANHPGNVNYPYDLVIPFDLYKILEPDAVANWSGNYQGSTFAVLADNRSEGDVERALASWKRQYLKPEDDGQIDYFLQPLADIHNETLYGSNPGGYTMAQATLNAAIAVAIFILIIAAVNFINLATAQASVRAREVGLKKVLGASRAEVIWQFVAENQLLVGLALLISAGMSQVALNQLNFFFTEIGLKLSFQWVDAGILIVIGALISIIATVYPSVAASAFRPIEALKGKKGGFTLKGQALRKSLIVFQFVVVQFLIISTLVIGSQVQFFMKKGGANPDNAVIVVPAPEFQKATAFRNQLMQIASIGDVAFGSGPPASINNTLYGATFRTPNQNENEAQKCEMKIGDLQYVEFFGLELIAGRNFSSIRQGYDEFIVNERLVNAMGWTPGEALGRVLNINGADATVVGVVKDFHNTTLHEPVVPCAIMNWVYFQDLSFIRLETTKDLSVTLAQIEAVWQTFSPDKTYSVSFLNHLIEKNYAIEKMMLSGFTAFSILAIVIGSLGLFGLMSFITLKKTKEVGIRKALGATVSQIVLLFTGDFAVLIGIAFCLVAPAAYLIMDQWLSGFAYRISIEWWMFAVGGTVALLIAMLTICYQSITSALANPVDALRNE